MQELRLKIISSLEDQGFNLNQGITGHNGEKNVYKDLHKVAKSQSIIEYKDYIIDNFKKVKPFLRNASDINPKNIDIEIREVEYGKIEADIFRWWNLVWWSVPFQRPYGRQMRFILWDKGHDAPLGIIGLQSPILKMAVRDKALNIPKDTLDIWINKSMQAQRLGALPPYNDLLGGKMVAMAVTSNEIRDAYQKKYANQTTIIKNRILSSDLLFTTTTSAFGRSSIYNRLKFEGDIVAQSLGFTKGAGSFHIPQNLYKEILLHLESNGVDIKRSFGNGPSRRLKLLHLGFKSLNLPDFTFHHIEREFFIFPYVSNLNQVIMEKELPIYYDRSLQQLQQHWLNRWCLKRSIDNANGLNFKYEDYLNNFAKEYKINIDYGW